MEDANQPLSLDDLKHKAIRGALSLTAGQLVLMGLTFLVVNLILPSLPSITPSIIGTFNIATTVIAFINFFSDVGLASALIQKKEITEHDLTTTFIIQEALITVLSLGLFIAAPFLAQFYHLDIGGSGLIRALAISFFISSFKSIPTVLLERNLRFKEVTISQIAEGIAKSAILLILALLNFGLYSYAFSEVAAAVLGAVLLYNFAPWKIGFTYSKSAAKELLKFGVPFQINSLLALFKDQTVDLVIAHMITATELGFVTLAQSWAFMPLQFMTIMIRVTFPAYARLQHDLALVGRAVEKSLYVMSLVLFPSIIGLLCIVSNLVVIIGPQKWGSVVPMVYLFSISTFFSSISTVYTNVFNAVGQIKLTLRLMIMWTALEWILTPLLVWQLGYIGVAIATALISLSSIVTIIYMRQITRVRLLDSIAKPIICSVGMGVVVYPAAHFFLQSKIMVIPVIALGGIVYAGLVLLIDRDRAVKQLKEVLYAIR